MKPTAARRRIWTVEKDATLIALHRGGDSYIFIARKMRISLNAAAGRIAVLIRRGVLDARHGKWVRGAEQRKTGVAVTQLGMDRSEPKGQGGVPVVLSDHITRLP
jgi:hypothetical protein